MNNTTVPQERTIDATLSLACHTCFITRTRNPSGTTASARRRDSRWGWSLPSGITMAALGARAAISAENRLRHNLAYLAPILQGRFARNAASGVEIFDVEPNDSRRHSRRPTAIG